MDISEVETTKRKNSWVNYLKSYGWLFLLIGALYFFAYPIRQYEIDHPITCDHQASVAEIILIDGAYAHVKMSDGTIAKKAILSRDYKGYSSPINVKVGDVFCLASSRK